MKFGVLGTGIVGQTIGSKLAKLGHKVMLGSRSADNEKALAWAKETGAGASQGSFADAASFGELVFNCTLGTASIDALRLAGASNLADKILIDVANPLDFSKGMPPSLFVFGEDSLAERIQREFPATRVVKSLNTVNCLVMVEPSRVPGEHDVFMSGNDAGAKSSVAILLKEEFGWKNVVDLGDISTARGTEAYLMLWLRFWQATGTGDLNIHLAKA
jgi:predicted dinucleotide-binding enzyme